MAEEKVVSIKVDLKANQKEIGRLEQDLKDISAQRSTLLKQSKQLADVGQKESQAYKDLGAKIGSLNLKQKELSKKKAEVTKQSTDYIKTLKTEDKSYDSLVAKNALLAKRLRALKDPLGKNKAEFQKLAGAIDKNTSELAEMDEAQGRFQRNVGNYPEMLGQINPMIGGMITSLKGATTAALAFVATPLGAVLAALVALAAPIVSFFKNTQQGMELLNKATAGLGAAMDVLVDRLSMFGSGLVDLISGDISGGLDKITDSFKGIGDELERETKIAIKLQEQLDQLAKDEAANTAQQALLRQKIVKLRVEAAEQEEINAARSAELVREAIALEKELAAEEESLKLRQFANLLALEDEEAARVRLNQLKNEGKELTIAELGLAESNVEDLQEANDLLAEIISAETSFFNAKRKFTKELNTLDKKAAAQAKQNSIEFNEIRIEGEIDFFGKKKDALIEHLEEEEELINEAEDKKIAAEIAKQEEKNQKLNSLDQDRVAIQLETAELAASALGLINTQQANAEVAEQKRRLEAGLITEEQYSEEVNRIKKKEFENNKKINLAMVAINTAAAITKIWAETPKFDFGASTVALTALAVANGAIQAATIASQQYQPTKFADGGVLQGASHANGGIPMTVGGVGGFEAEGGEAIINKKSTSMFMPLLSAINQAGGGVAFSNALSPAKFARGGLTPSINTTTNMTDIVTAINKRIDNIRVVNVATDTAATANRVANIQNDASF